MLARTEPACLVIADIAGYSGYLAGVELDHAQDILADLVDTVVGALRPSFKLAKLEGDAAFVWVPAATVDGPGLRDVIERCYFAFQRRIRDIRQASTCECNACVRIPGLDLKFVAHHGLVARQRMAGREELVGSDVVVVHRLLKNRVSEELGVPAYALYTDALVGAMGLDDPAAAGMHEYRETFESVGEVEGWVTDLGAAWEAEQAARADEGDRRRCARGDHHPRGRPARDPLGMGDLAGPADPLDVGHDGGRSRTSQTAGGGSAPSTTASTARTCPSRRSSTGSRRSTRRSGSPPGSGAFPGSSSRRSSSRAARIRPTSSIGWPGRARSRTGSSCRRWRGSSGRPWCATAHRSSSSPGPTPRSVPPAVPTEPDVPASTARHLSAPMAATGGPIAYLSDEGGAG